MVGSSQAPKSSPNPRVCAIVSAALVAVVAAIYAQVRAFGPITFDDSTYVFANPHVRTDVSLENLHWALTTGHAGNWHPLTWLSHMVDVQFFGLDPGLHHLSNVALHAIDAVLLFVLLVYLTRSTWRSALVAALFAVHPLNVESVAWIAERKSVLSTLFWLLTTIAYASYVRKAATSDAARRWPVWGGYALVLGLYGLGLMTKPMLVSLPITLLLLDYWPLGRTLRWRVLIEKLPMLAMAAASCWITLLVQQAGGMTRSLEQFPLGQRIANAIVAYLEYLWKMVWPSDLCVLYPHPRAGLPEWLVLLSASALVAVTGAAWSARRNRPHLLVGWAWYVITLVPVIGIVQVGPQSMADRYAYIPLMGVFVAIVWSLPDAVSKGRRLALTAAACIAVGALATVAWGQVRYWKNADTVFQHALSVTGRHRDVIYCQAGALVDSGKPDQALVVLRQALRSSPEPAVIHNYIGMIVSREGHLDQAISEYRTAVAIEPHYAVGHNNLGIALAKSGDLPGAEAHLRRAIRLKHDYAEAHHSLGVVLYEQGKVSEAADEWREALRIDPSFEASRRRLEALHDGGRSEW